MGEMNLIERLRELVSKARPGPRYATIDQPADPDEELRDTWTISLSPNETGWENDSNYYRYGLPRADAEFHAAASPETVQKLITAIETLTGAMEEALKYCEHGNPCPRTKADCNTHEHRLAWEALAQVRELLK